MKSFHFNVEIQDEEFNILSNCDFKKYQKYNSANKVFKTGKVKEVLDKGILLSYTSISEYYKCPYSFYLNRVLKIKKESNFDSILEEFDKIIGLDYLKVIHINDSKNEQGSHKDRHANFGVGSLGFDTLINVIYNERLTNVPKILETPYIGDTDDSKERIYPPYKFEIEMIRNNKFDENIKTKIREYYKK